MSWSKDYKKSIDCGNPKGFSQKAHCAARQKRKRGEETKSKSPFSEENQMSETRYCKLCRKMEQRDECSYGPSMWDRYTSSTILPTENQLKYDPNRPHPANESKDHEYSMARSELSTIVKSAKRLQKKMKKGEGNIEAWVQSKITKAADYIDTAADYVDSGEMNEEKLKCGEGKYWCRTDKKCKSVPKGYHVMPNGDLMKDSEHEESGDVSEAKRDGKSAKDKDYSLRDWFKGGGWVQAGGKYDGKPCARQPGQKTKPFCRDADDRASMSKEERNRRAAKKRKEDPNPNRSGKANFVTAEQVDATKYGGPDKLLKKLVPKYGGGEVIPSTPKKSANIEKAHFEPQGEQLDELAPLVAGGLALGAGALGLAAIRRAQQSAKSGVEAAKKGEKIQQGIGVGNAAYGIQKRSDATREALKLLRQETEVEGELIDEKKDACYSKVKSRYKVWPSAYASGALVKCRKVGAANWGNKSESYEFSNWRDEFFPTEIETVDIIKPEPIKGVQEDKDPCWDGYKQVGMKKKGKRMVPNCVKEGYSNWREELSEDWQKVNRQDKTDGLSQAAVDAYRRENPGSKLQTAVTEKKPTGKRAKRRANFCRRMKGMKSKLTSAKTARDPDSRINKALRRWRCN